MKTNRSFKFFSLVALPLIMWGNAARAELPTEYETWNASAKQELLWSHILESNYSELPKTAPWLVTAFKLISPEYLRTSFLRVSDELPVGRKRLLHPLGTVAAVVLKINPEFSRYTGLFRSGGVGLVRLSLATPLTTPYVPGMGLKIFVDQGSSINFQALYSLDGQGDNHNFFAHKLSTAIPKPHFWFLKPFEKLFRYASDTLSNNPQNRPQNELTLPLYEAARVSADGSTVDEVVDPYSVVFIPNPQLSMDPQTPRDFRKELGDIPENTILYWVAVKRTAAAPEELIGELITQSRFVASEYGDEKLFFQHQRLRNPNVNPQITP
jgi:hypothetical protein